MLVNNIKYASMAIQAFFLIMMVIDPSYAQNFFIFYGVITVATNLISGLIDIKMNK